MSLATSVMYQVVLGISYGMLLVLVALGLSLIFGIMGTINFSHGALMMLGAYFGFEMVRVTNSFFVALVVAPIAVGIVAMAIEPLILRPLYEQDPLYQLLSTWGAALVITELIRIVWGLDSVPFDSPGVFAGTVSVLGQGFPIYRFFMIVLAGAIVGTLFLMLNRTDFGIVIRASTYKHETVEMLGVNLNRTFTVVFGIGAALAALAGVLVGPVSVVSPELGNAWIIQAFIVVVVGGLGSLRGAVLAGLLIGVVNSLFTMAFPTISGFAIYLIMAVTLIVRPQGLMGKGAFHET